MLSVFLLTSCISQTIVPADSTGTIGDDTSENTEIITENTPVSDGFPVKNLTVADNAIGLYTVVYPNDASDTVEYAADEFLAYIFASTGIHLSCEKDADSDAQYKIHIGKTSPLPDKIKQKLTRMADEGYYFLCSGNDLYITGNNDRGTLYGVYSFLEEYIGVRYYTPDCERILKSEGINIPGDLDAHFVPTFDFRDCFWFEALDPEFSAKQKINSCISRDLDAFGGGKAYADGTVHTVSSLAKSDDTVICLTDEEIYKTVLGNAKKWLADTPGTNIISLSSGEKSSKTCSCKSCSDINKSEGTSLGTFIVFINKLAADLKEVRSDIFIDTLISDVTIKPPKITSASDNVIIRISSVDACFSHAINECAANSIDEHISAWGKRCENLYVWDYTTNFMFYLCPFPNLFTIFDNVKFYADNNVTGIFEQGNYHSASGEFGELRAYLLSKLLWDPDMTKDEYLAYMYDFLEGYYGEGWEYILEYINKTSEAASVSHMFVFTGVKTILGNKKSNDQLAAFTVELSNLWTKAYNATTETVCRRHVEKSKIQIDYYTMYVLWDEEKHPELLENMYSRLKKYNITHFREGKQIPSLASFDASPSTW